MKFELDEDEDKKFKEWSEHIKAIHGEYGLYDYTYTPNGIGYELKVYSHVAKVSLDLTDVSKW